MRKLKIKTVKESSGLKKVNSNQTLTSQFPRGEILEIIDSAKKFVKGKRLDTLRQFADGYHKEYYGTNPGKLSLKNINSVGETAYQRAIFELEKAKLNTIGEVVWIDIELPVVLNKSRRRKCVDLIGTLANNTSVLCELKFGTKQNHSDSPVYAVIELLIYYYLIRDNYEGLDIENVFHDDKRVISFEWKDFNHNSILIVGANEAYWTYWQNRYERERLKNEVELWCRSLLPLNILFFSSDKFDQGEWTEVSL